MKNKASAPALGRRLSWWLAIQTFFELGLVCIAVFVITAMTLSHRQDETLDRKMAMVRHLLTEKPTSHSDLAELKHQLDDFLAGHEEISVELRSGNGQTLYASSSSGLLTAPIKQRVFKSVAPDYLAGSVNATLTLGTSEDEQLLRRLAWTLAAAALIGSVAASLGCFCLVRLGLAPLRHLVEQTQNLNVGVLDRPLDGSSQPKELQPLIEQFNALLARLNDSYAQMKGFNADVAHELNTPLATLISSCELGLRKNRNVEELRELLASNLEELHRVSGIVKDMLFLSQADRGADARRVEVNDLAKLAEEVIEFHEAPLQEAQLKAKVIGNATGLFDVRLLQRALSNLLDNATRYATPGSIVLLKIERNAQAEVVIMVCNQGPTISPDDLPRIFDRFYRSDPARAQGDKNHGLGLAIVAAIARMHGGQAIAESESGFTQIGLVLNDGLS